jgi:hypothetical protein
LEVLEGLAERGGDGLLLDGSDFLLGGRVGVERRIGVDGRKGFEEGIWGFDYEQGGDETAKGVTDLGGRLAGVERV